MEWFLNSTGIQKLQIMEFRVGGELFCIDMERIQKLLLSVPTKGLSGLSPAVEGIFKYKDASQAVLDMSYYLLETPTDPTEKDIFLLTKDALHIALRVQSIEGICQVDRNSLRQADRLPDGIRPEAIAGEAVCDGQRVLLPDYDRIISEVEPLLRPRMQEINRRKRERLCKQPLVIAEPVPLTAVFLRDALTKSGYTNLHIYPNGRALWDALCTFREQGTLAENAALVITDLEMPYLGGFDLIKRIRGDADLQGLPVLGAALTLTEEERASLREVGADGAFSKPEFRDMAVCIDQLLEKNFDMDVGV